MTSHASRYTDYGYTSNESTRESRRPRAIPRDASHLLPLTDLAFNILVALTDREPHGYALIKELRGRTGRAKLRTGTVYAGLARLQDDRRVPIFGTEPRFHLAGGNHPGRRDRREHHRRRYRRSSAILSHVLRAGSRGGTGRRGAQTEVPHTEVAESCCG